jgi:periplasmic copper chaperone A
MRRMVLAALALMSCSAAVACGGGENSTTAPDVLTVSRAWARPTPADATQAVVYLTVTSPSDDTLVGAVPPADVAGVASLHLTAGESSNGEHHHGSDAGDPGSNAWGVSAGKPLELVPDGQHILLEALARPLEAGAAFDVTLNFASGLSAVARVTVSDNPPA